MNWDDLRAFLATARSGSLRRAAETLGVTQPTVARRIRSLENDLGLPLFDRDRDGHRLTAAGAELLPEARAVETTALRVEARSRDMVGGLTETVRVEAMEWAAAVLARGLDRLGPRPRVDLVVAGDTRPDGVRRPEIVVRHRMPPEGEGVTWRVGSIGSAVYGMSAYAEGRPLPLDREDFAALPWIAFIAEQEHFAAMQWITRLTAGRNPAARVSRTDQMAMAAASGLGVAILPCFLGDATPGILRLSPELDDLRADYWVVTAQEFAGNPSVRSVTAWIAACFRAAELGEHGS